MCRAAVTSAQQAHRGRTFAGLQHWKMPWKTDLLKKSTGAKTNKAQLVVNDQHLAVVVHLKINADQVLRVDTPASRLRFDLQDRVNWAQEQRRSTDSAVIRFIEKLSSRHFVHEVLCNRTMQELKSSAMSTTEVLLSRSALTITAECVTPLPTPNSLCWAFRTLLFSFVHAGVSTHLNSAIASCEASCERLPSDSAALPRLWPGFVPRVQRAHLDWDTSATIDPSSSLYLVFHARLALFQRLPLTTVYRESSRCLHPPSLEVLRSALGSRFACGLGTLRDLVLFGCCLFLFCSDWQCVSLFWSSCLWSGTSSLAGLSLSMASERLPDSYDLGDGRSIRGCKTALCVAFSLVWTFAHEVISSQSCQSVALRCYHALVSSASTLTLLPAWTLDRRC